MFKWYHLYFVFVCRNLRLRGPQICVKKFQGATNFAFLPVSLYLCHHQSQVRKCGVPPFAETLTDLWKHSLPSNTTPRQKVPQTPHMWHDDMALYAFLARSGSCVLRVTFASSPFDAMASFDGRCPSPPVNSPPLSLALLLSSLSEPRCL